jgi:hypothetical protein
LQDKGTGAGEPPGTRRGSGTDAERYARALYGTPDQGVEVYVPLVGGSLSVAAGGCRGQALRALFPQDAPRALGLTAFLENVASTAFARVDDSPELRPANEAWAACMAGADPGPAQGDEPLRSPYAAEGAASTYVQQHEGTSLGVGAPLQLAVADANCQERTGYRERRTLVEDRYLQGYLDAYAGEVREARDVLTRAGVRARAVLAR